MPNLAYRGSQLNHGWLLFIGSSAHRNPARAEALVTMSDAGRCHVSELDTCQPKDSCLFLRRRTEAAFIKMDASWINGSISNKAAMKCTFGQTLLAKLARLRAMIAASFRLAAICCVTPWMIFVSNSLAMPLIPVLRLSKQCSVRGGSRMECGGSVRYFRNAPRSVSGGRQGSCTLRSSRPLDDCSWPYADGRLAGQR